MEQDKTSKLTKGQQKDTDTDKEIDTDECTKVDVISKQVDGRNDFKLADAKLKSAVEGSHDAAVEGSHDAAVEGSHDVTAADTSFVTRKPKILATADETDEKDLFQLKTPKQTKSDTVDNKVSFDQSMLRKTNVGDETRTSDLEERHESAQQVPSKNELGNILGKNNWIIWHAARFPCNILSKVGGV